jgi:hypothetical protein
MPMLPGFCGGAYKSRSSNFDAQRCLNLFPSIADNPHAKSQMMLIGTPGLKLYADLTPSGGNIIRGMLVFNTDSLYIVTGNQVYFKTASTAAVLIGTIIYGSTPVSMATNGTTIFFVTGNEGYSINTTTNVVTQYIDPSFTGANKVAFVDGSFIFNQPGTGKFWAMNPYSLTLNPLYFATAEGSPDRLLSLIVDHREIWLFGSETTEVWANTGDALGFPFSRIGGAFIEQGIAAIHSAAKMDNSVFWLAANERGQGLVYRARGFTPERISTAAIEFEFTKYSTIADAVAYTYLQEGHNFYVLNFPTAQKTWVFDSTTELWHERSWRNSNGVFGRHRGNCHAYFDRKNLVGDWELGRIYELDLDTYTDNGDPIVRTRAAPHIAVELQRLSHRTLHIDMEAGVGLQNAFPNNGFLTVGFDPQASLRWSDDGAHTWSSRREAPIGKLGKYKQRVRWTRLGQSRDRVYEVTITDPIKVIIMGAMLNGQ